MSVSCESRSVTPNRTRRNDAVDLVFWIFLFSGAVYYENVASPTILETVTATFFKSEFTEHYTITKNSLFRIS